MNKDRIKVSHILDAGREATSFIESISFDEFCADRMRVLAVLKCLEIMGEAASKVSFEFQEHNPDFPWKQLASMRNRLIHGYFEINLEIVWNTLKIDIPITLVKAEKIL